MPGYRLPRILAESPGTSPYRPARAPQAGDSGVAAAIGAAGSNISRTLFDFAALEQEKKKVATGQEVNAMTADLELGVAKGDSDLRAILRDPDEYRTEHEKMVEQVARGVRDRAKSGESAAAFDAKTAGYIGRQKAEAYRHSNTLYKERGLGQLDATLESRKTLAGLATDDTVFQQQLKEGQAAITAAIPLIGEDKAGDLSRKFKADVLEARALAEANENPEAFVSRSTTRYADLDPKKREELEEKARDKIKAITAEAVRAEEKRQETAAKISEQNRQYRLLGMAVSADKKELGVQQVYDAAERGDIVDRTELGTMLTLARKGTAIESDGATWSAVQADVWSENPTYTEKRIQSLMARAVEGGVGLGGEHGRMALTELQSRRQNGTQQVNEQRRLANDAYNRAKEEAFTALGITTPFSMLDKTDQKLVSDFLRTFNANVLDAQGNVRTDVPVRQVMVDTLPAFHNQKSADTRLNYQKQSEIVRELTGAQVPDIMDPAFVGWFTKQQKEAEALGADPKTLNLYKLRRDQLLNLARSRNDYLKAEASKAAAAAGGKSKGGYTAPKE